MNARSSMRPRPWFLALAVLGACWPASPGLFAEEPRFASTAGRSDTLVRVTSEGAATIVDIESRFGIDHVTIQRRIERWPTNTVVRLHLSGLESLTISNGTVTLEAAVSGTAGGEKRISLRDGDRTGDKVQPLDKTSPYWIDIRLVGGQTIPLKNGYFELPLPKKLSQGNPKSLTLSWIDFYRN